MFIFLIAEKADFPALEFDYLIHMTWFAEFMTEEGQSLWTPNPQIQTRLTDLGNPLS